MQASADDLAGLADEFCQASIAGHTDRPVQLLAARPELAGYNLATALVLGDVDKVAAAIEADPTVVTRRDPRFGWPALHAACASRWHRLDPSRAAGLLAVATALLDAGADVNGSPEPARAAHWTPLLCAVAGAPNPAITQLLLERGAVPTDEALYLAGFEPDHRCLRLLLDHTADVRAVARKALAAPISGDDVAGVRLLLEAGADPGQYHDDDGRPCAVSYAVVRSNRSAEIMDLLLASGADAARPGPDGTSPLALATSMGRADLVELLGQHGAADDATDVDRLLAACVRADRATAQRLVSGQPGLLSQLTGEQQASTMTGAAEAGRTDALRLMLDLGFDVAARSPDNGSTALHAAAFAGSAAAVGLLTERGADLEARDTEWDSTPVGWAVVGSGIQPAGNPAADWLATTRALIEAGASLDGITLSPDDLKPPSAAVADLLRRHGVREEPGIGA